MTPARFPSASLRRLAAIAVIAINAAPLVAQQPAPVTIDRYRVERVHEERCILTFSRDSTDDVALGDRVVFLSDDGRVALGRVFALDDQHFAAKMDPGPLPAPEDLVSRVPANADSLLRPWLPDGTSLWARVDAATTNSTAVWLNRGTRHGFRPSDRLYVLRRDLPVARLELDRVFPDAALASMTPLFADATLVAGDWARLWPAPADAVDGAQTTRVMNAKPTDQGLEVWLPMDRRDGVALGDRWEIRRDGHYIDLVEIVEFRHRFAIARGGQAFARDRVQVGDEASRRRPSAVAAGRCAMRVFRVEGDYCLLNAGENEGLAEAMTVTIVNPDGAAAAWTIETVKIDYSGARVGVLKATSEAEHGTELPSASQPATSHPADGSSATTSRPSSTQSTRPADRVRIQPWAQAYLVPPLPPRPPIGRIVRLFDDSTFALIEWTPNASPPALGMVLRLESHSPGATSRPAPRIHTTTPPPAAAVVVAAAKSRAVVYIPAATHTGDVASDWDVRLP